MSGHTIICLWFPYLSVENAFKDNSKFKKKPFSDLKILLHGVLEGKILTILELLDWSESIRNINNLTHTYNDEYLKTISSKI